ncbi:MAG: winged helix-turn-helix transcriptional regulator [Candidatus Aenigmarchaeota archaeon]|nr:winged helix-turn-helix transcriptional regulator [Candidatus Aenigmarchaeota archaeon]
MYEAELNELGLTSNETKIYLALLKNKLLTPAKISKKTGLHRSYIYDAIERLMEKGVVSEVIVNNKKHYQALDPKIFREMLESKLKHFDSVLPYLSNVFISGKNETRIELHRGEKVFRTLIKYVTANMEKNDTVYLLGANEKFLKSIEPLYLKQYFTTIKKKNVRERVIIPKGGEKIRNPNIEYREMEPKYFGEITIVIHQTRVFIFIQEMPHHLIIIDSSAFANSYKKQFELLWKVSERISKLKGCVKQSRVKPLEIKKIWEM